jgi:hypothetical protein
MAIEDDFNALQQQPGIEADFQALQSNPQAVPDNQESQFISPDAQKAAETQDILGNPKDSNFDTSGLEPWQYQGGLVTGSKREPGFMKTLDMLNTGVHRGVTHFTLGLMSMLPFGDKYQKAIKQVDSDVEAEQQKNIKTYNSATPVVGEIGGELLATAPAGGLLGGVAKAANALADVAPTGLKLLSRYGTSGVGGAGILSGTTALEYQGDQFDPAKATDKFKEGMLSPLNYVAPMAGQALGRYLDKSRALQKVTDEGTDVLPRDLKEKGPGRTLSYLFYDSLPMMTNMGRRVQQLGDIGESIGNVVRKISGTPEAMTSDDLINYAGKNLQMGLQGLKAKETLLWDKPFAKTLVSDVASVRDLGTQAQKILAETSLPNVNRVNNQIQLILDKGEKLTIDDVKKLRSHISKSASDAYAQPGGTGYDIGKDLSELRNKLYEPMESSMGVNDLKDFKAATTFSKSQYELEDSLPAVKKAIKSEIEANKIIEGIIKDSVSFDKSKAMELMSEKGQRATKGAIVAKALESSASDTGVNLTAFLKKVAPPEGTSTAEKLLGNEYQHIEGLAKHLSAINEAKRIGSFGKFAAIGTGAGAAAGLGVAASQGTGNSDWSTTAAMVSYPVMLMAANNPVLKRLLGASTRKLSDSTYKHINNKIQDIFTRAGYLYNEDGTMSKKGDDE